MTYPITPRQSEVLSLVRKGFTSVKIASILEVSPRSVESHVGKLLAITHTPNRVALVMIPPEEFTVRNPRGKKSDIDNTEVIEEQSQPTSVQETQQ